MPNFCLLSCAFLYQHNSFNLRIFLHLRLNKNQTISQLSYQKKLSGTKLILLFFSMEDTWNFIFGSLEKGKITVARLQNTL